MLSSRSRLVIALIIGSSAAQASARPATSAAPLIVPPDGVLEADVQGQPSRLLMMADSGSAPVLNSADAERLGIGTGWIGVAVKVKVGPVPVKGLTGVIRYRVGGMDMKRRGAWFERNIVQGHAGMIGPAAVAQSVVTFQLRNAVPGEQTFSLSLADKGYAGMGTLVGDLFVQFDPLRLNSMVTAAGGADLASEYQGSLVGAVRQEVIRFGISRPVRTMRMEQPMQIGGIVLNTVNVRTSDYGNSSSIPDTTQDPDEIVVVGRRATSESSRTLLLGADALHNCSSITFDKARREIRLSCWSETRNSSRLQ